MFTSQSRSPRNAPIAVLLCILLLLLLPTVSQADLKIWTPPSAPALATSAWPQVGSDRACAQRTLVFRPDGHIESLAALNGADPIQRIVLPRDGMLLLNNNDNAAAPFRLAAPAPSACNPDKSYLLQPAHRPPYWFDPGAWRTADAAPNAARPPVNRVPCECDSVRLAAADQRTAAAAAATWAIRLHDTDEIVVRDVRLDGSNRSDSMERFLQSRNGALLFTSTGQPAAHTARCTGPQRTCGCHAIERLEAVEEAVCSTVLCAEEAQCLDPITVAGWCCPVCGAQILVEQSDACPLDDEALTSDVHRMLRDMDGGRWLQLVDYDWSVVAQRKADGGVEYRGQLMLVDKGGVYKGHSAELAANLLHLKRKMGEWERDCTFCNENESFFQPPAVIHFVQIAGAAHHTGDRTPLSVLVVGSLLLVLAAYGALYAHYVHGCGGRAATVLDRRLRRTFGAPMRFSRFDNVSLAGGLAAGEPTTTTTTTAASVPTTADDADGTPRMTAFDNPLFRAAGSAVEIVTEDRGPNVLNEATAAVATAADGGGDAIHELGFECAGLVDVDLDSSETKI